MKNYNQTIKNIARKVMPYVLAGTIALSVKAGDELSSKVNEEENFVGGSAVEIEGDTWCRNNEGKWTTDSDGYENTTMEDSEIKYKLNKPKYNLFILK